MCAVCTDQIPPPILYPPCHIYTFLIPNNHPSGQFLFELPHLRGKKNTQCLSFCVWFVTLNIMSSISILLQIEGFLVCVRESGRVNKTPPSVSPTLSLFIHPSIIRFLCRFLTFLLWMVSHLWQSDFSTCGYILSSGVVGAMINLHCQLGWI